jgi:hypothetical protein
MLEDRRAGQAKRLSVAKICWLTAIAGLWWSNFMSGGQSTGRGLLSGLATEESQSRKKLRWKNEINFINANLLGNMQLFVSQYEN